MAGRDGASLGRSGSQRDGVGYVGLHGEVTIIGGGVGLEAGEKAVAAALPTDEHFGTGQGVEQGVPGEYLDAGCGRVADALLVEQSIGGWWRG